LKYVIRNGKATTVDRAEKGHSRSKKSKHKTLQKGWTNPGPGRKKSIHGGKEEQFLVRLSFARSMGLVRLIKRLDITNDIALSNRALKKK
jgi:hypothetical protein